MVAAAGLGVAQLTLLHAEQPFSPAFFNWPAILLAAAVLVLTRWVPKVKDWHPIVFIAIGAAVGVIGNF